MRYWLALLALVATPAVAEDCGYEQCWGAVAFGPFGAHGYSYDQPDQNRARELAMRGCKQRCTVVRTFFNACAAIAEADDGAWGWAWAETPGLAIQNATRQCEARGTGCEIRVWACSG